MAKDPTKTESDNLPEKEEAAVAPMTSHSERRGTGKIVRLTEADIEASQLVKGTATEAEGVPGQLVKGTTAIEMPTVVAKGTPLFAVENTKPSAPWREVGADRCFALGIYDHAPIFSFMGECEHNTTSRITTFRSQVSEGIYRTIMGELEKGLGGLKPGSRVSGNLRLMELTITKRDQLISSIASCLSEYSHKSRIDLGDVKREVQDELTSSVKSIVLRWMYKSKSDPDYAIGDSHTFALDVSEALNRAVQTLTGRDTSFDLHATVNCLVLPEPTKKNNHIAAVSHWLLKGGPSCETIGISVYLDYLEGKVGHLSRATSQQIISTINEMDREDLTEVLKTASSRAKAVELDEATILSAVGFSGGGREAEIAAIKELESEKAKHDAMKASVFGKSDPSIAGIRSYVKRVRQETETQTELNRKKEIRNAINYWKSERTGWAGYNLYYQEEECNLAVRDNDSTGTFRLRKCGGTRSDITFDKPTRFPDLSVRRRSKKKKSK